MNVTAWAWGTRRGGQDRLPFCLRAPWKSGPNICLASCQSQAIQMCLQQQWAGRKRRAPPSPELGLHGSPLPSPSFHQSFATRAPPASVPHLREMPSQAPPHSFGGHSRSRSRLLSTPRPGPSLHTWAPRPHALLGLHTPPWTRVLTRAWAAAATQATAWSAASGAGTPRPPRSPHDLCKG